MGRGSWLVIADDWIFAQASAEGDNLRRGKVSVLTHSWHTKLVEVYLLSQLLKMFTDQIVAAWMEQNREAVRIAEGDQM